ncbi:sensor histidine kinase [Hymenobacter metallicola]|uniref:Oxygen sensor histidine kinase NreB n=1 Tax=Hymenobacter metallicola TaxID=2563114 RepID=A0A4Z0Q2J6_9BACT|nr:PAS domain-containing protein [Hymenobacter metallicola]TGE23353.1 PAS domain S-box protein [Hymenobacter metallicola]
MPAASSSSAQLSAEVLQVYESLPDPYLILSREFVILAVTDAYLAATLTYRSVLLGRTVFEAFPENPAATIPAEHSSYSLRASFERVLATAQPDQLPVQRYDVRWPEAGSEVFEEKYWRIRNTPILAADGTVQGIINKVVDVTELVQQGHRIEDLSREVDLTKALHQRNSLLVQQLQKATLLLDTINEAYLEINTSGEYTYLNRRAEELLGVGRQDLLGRPLADTALAALGPEAQQLLQRAQQTGQRAEGEYVCHRVGHWLYMSATPTKDGVIVLFYDIQAVKESGEKLRQEHRRLKESQAIGHIGSFEVVVASGQVYWTDELYRIHGLEPQSQPLTVQDTLDFLYPEDEWAFRELLRSFASQGRFVLVHRIRRRDGTVRLVETRTEVQRDAHGQISTLYGTVQDVTEMKQAEKEARDSATQFQTLVENTPDIITRWNQQLHLIFANSAYSQRMGRPMAELLGKTNREMLHPEAVAGPWMEKLRLVLDTGLAQDHYNSVETAVGIKYFFSRLVPEKAENGSVLSVLAIAREITDIKRLEKEHLHLQLSQQKQLLNAVLEAQEVERRRIAESLHNGLAQVLYATKLHLEQIQPSPQSPTYQQVLQAKVRAGQFLSEAIKTTRTISHELIPTTLEDFGLAAAIKDVCQQMSHGVLRIQCQVTGLSEVPLEKYLGLAVYRLVQELVNNIVKHAQATQARVVVNHDVTAIRLTAQDNGRGFDPQQPHKGIGLKTLRDRVKLLGGTADIFAAPGQGTTVTVWFPVERE